VLETFSGILDGVNITLVHAKRNQDLSYNFDKIKEEGLQRWIVTMGGGTSYVTSILYYYLSKQLIEVQGRFGVEKDSEQNNSNSKKKVVPRKRKRRKKVNT